MKHKYCVGDKIRVIKDLDDHRFPGDPGVVSEMYDVQDCRSTIRKILPFNGRSFSYLIEDDIWTWAEEWLEPCEPEVELNTDDILFLLKE